MPKDEVEESGLKAVNKHLKMQRSCLFFYSSFNYIRNNQGSCQGQGIYVYDLPSKFNKDLLQECSDMVPWNLGKGWFNTHQYSVEPIFHSRVLKHPCRVYDENRAKLFYVPFYGGMDVLRWHFKNVTEHLKDVLAIEVLKSLQENIKDSEGKNRSKQSWRKNSGKDHVFVLGKISWDFRRNNKFASLVSVCILVIFDPYTAYYQYAWHLPEDHRTYSVYINKDDLKAKKVNVIKKLMLVTIREREDMRSYIVHELLPGLVYGDPNANFERFRDAFDITMDSLLHKISKNL
ncbi:hypothetical protein Bca101_037219 [Brassica carinata]